MGKVVRCNKQDGKAIFEKECLYKRGQIRKDDKACLQCPFKKENPPQVVVNKARDLAKAYLDGKSIFQESIFCDPILEEKVRDVTLQPDEQLSDRISHIFKKAGRNVTLQSLAQEAYGNQSKDDSVTKALKNLRLRLPIEKKINATLADFTLSISIARMGNVKNKTNKKGDIGRTISHLEKAQLNTQSLLDQTKTKIEEVLDGVRVYKNVKKRYSEISEIDYILKLSRAWYWSRVLDGLNELFKPEKDKIFKSETIFPNTIRIPPPGVIESEYIPLPTRGTLRKVLTVEEKVSKLRFLAENESRLRDFVSEEVKKLRDSISASVANIKLEVGAPIKLFFKAMQIVVFKILSEAGKIRKEEAKRHAATIINEYLKANGFPNLANLNSKDIDNALHS